MLLIACAKKIQRLIGAVFVAILLGAGSGFDPCLANERDAAQSEDFFATDPVFGSSTYFKRYGDPKNPAIVLVHGLGDNAANDWAGVIPALTGDFEVLVFDLPGFGRSSRANLLYSPSRYARFIDWVVRSYIDRPFTLVGHSMGGAIALEYAATQPEQLQQLVLIDVAGVLHRTNFSRKAVNRIRPAWWWDIIPSTNTEKLENLLGFNLEDVERAAGPIDGILNQPLGRKVFLSGDPGKIAGLALVQHNFSGALKNVTVPTDIIWGESDDIAPVRTGHILARRIPNARLTIMPDTDHVPMISRVSQFNNLLLRILDTPAQPNPDYESFPPTEPAKTRCSGKEDQRFSGRFETLEIIGCKRVLIQDAEIARLVIRNSSVEILRSRLVGSGTTLEIAESILVATASEIDAGKPLLINNSRLDFAGVQLKAPEKVFVAKGESTLLASVSTLTIPARRGYLHGVFSIVPGMTFP